MEEEEQYLTKKDQAKQLFVAGMFAEAYQAYLECTSICSFKDQLVTLHTNMAMCSIKLARYEQAFFDCQRALEQSKGAQIEPEIIIKLKYRLALCLAHFRDYKGAANMLKHLKKYCNLHEQVEMFSQTQRLHEKVCELENNREHAKYRGTTFAAGPRASLQTKYTETSSNILFRIGDYVSPKLEIGEVEGKGRCVTAQEKVNKGETLMVCQALASQIRNPFTSKQEVKQVQQGKLVD